MTSELAQAEEESGSSLRTKFEATRKVLVETVVASHPGVKATDFDDVEPDQFVTRATELQATRKAEREALLREALTDRGVPETELDSALSQLTGPAPAAAQSAADRVAALGSLGGSPPAPQMPDVFGEDRIKAALQRSAKKRP